MGIFSTFLAIRNMFITHKLIISEHFKETMGKNQALSLVNNNNIKSIA
jgi:hypothetical protein